ncbi:hypothetical protein MYCTH_2307479 [Thermothelomyces thermophilus ATCC 42464]|uniref:RING-type domain-containing protein n=1 Tax=Thermothelomyces thermophilus (strain ATCC 42464 / BCRC 31852 / DSM 1799) TaxID=573729 RepID=G2QFX8_THET4|nr:uncharacterized protein MYCTH_2307479 [Thermothelomyces thermophilus ATCC 42464]AEO59292.1 hypothetical protein MYCTH_2307479 [Thermothelomyces thermophilus ATCC 42464]
MTETCKACHDPLIISLDPEDLDNGENQPQTVPDDLLLPCGCHFHWQCLLDESSTIVSTLSCPSCNTYLSSNAAGASSSSSSSAPAPADPVILTHYTNEGGVDPSLDIYPSLAEEAYLTAHPEARPARAFHTLVSEGEVQGMVELLADVDGNEEAPLSAAQLLAWRDPLNGGRSALHVALEARQEEAVWLLLWLGSRARREDFPEAVVQVAAANGLPRRLEGVEDGEDVRFVKDERGRTAGDVCLELGEPWTKLVEGGLFS